jgi:hypothetical protein
MPTSTEYRQRAKECLELTKVPNEWYVKTALVKMAIEFRKRAERLEYDEQGPVQPQCGDVEGLNRARERGVSPQRAMNFATH